jgi:excisionase family DNA binding protein
MILFESVNKLVAFLEKHLSEKIKEELFNDVYYFEHKGIRREGKIRLKPIAIVQKLSKYEFVIGVTTNIEQLSFPVKYILLWSRLEKFLKVSDSFSNEQEIYALISINKACQLLDVTRPTLYKIINEKKIPYVQILSQKRIQLKDLLDYIDNNKKYK